jgi:ketosteroid isomerase-like protein
VRRILCVALLVSTAAFAQSSSDQQASPPRKKGITPTRQYAADPTAVPGRPMMRAIWDAWQTMSAVNAQKFYSKDPDLVFYDIAPMKYTGWEQYSKGAEQFVNSQFTSFHATINDDANVLTSGDAALGTATVHLVTQNKDGSSSTFDVRWTLVWHKQNEQWLIVHEHLSAPLGKSGSR